MSMCDIFSYSKMKSPPKYLHLERILYLRGTIHFEWSSTYLTENSLIEKRCILLR